MLDHCPVNAILREDFIYRFFLNILIVLTVKSGLSKINTFEWKAFDKQCVPLKKVWFNTVITGLFHKNYTNMQFFCQSTQAVVVVFHPLAQSSLLKSFFFNLIFFFLFSVKKPSNHHSQFWSWFWWSARAHHWLVQWKGEDILSNCKRKSKLMSSNSSIDSKMGQSRTVSYSDLLLPYLLNTSTLNRPQRVSLTSHFTQQ